MAQEQAQGSTTRLLFDRESTYKTSPTAGSRKIRRLPFNACGLTKTRPLNPSTTLTGKRNPRQPWRGSIDVSGPITVPVDRINVGYWLAMLFGNPTTTASTPSSILTGAPSIVISSGVATLSVAQTDWAVGDRIAYTVGGSTVYAYIKTINSTTECVVVDEEGYDTISDVSTGSSISVDDIKRVIYTHVFKIANCANIPSFLLEVSDCAQDEPTYELYNGVKVASMSLTTSGEGDEFIMNLDLLGAKYTKSEDVSNGGTVTISSGTAEFSVAQDTTELSVGDVLIYGDDYDVAYVTVITDADTMTVKTQRGGSTNPSDVTDATVQAFLTDADYSGGGQDEIIEQNFNRYEMEDAAISEGGSTTELVRTFVINFSNNLEAGNFVIGGGGIRRSIPNGVAEVGGNFEVIFENDQLLQKAEDRTETSFSLALTHPDAESSLTFAIDEVQIEESSPDVPGPQGRIYAANFQGYYDDDSDETAIKITLVNTQPVYDY